jgi:imidazolonepropionase-like amidohydrolase
MLLKSATVISMAGPDSAPGARADVLIADGRIAQVAAQIAVPEDGRAIDLRGKFLIPGLIDAHCHITTSGDPIEVEVAHDPRTRILRAAHNAGMTLLAGITTIRDTCGLDDSDIVLRDAIRSGQIPGPRIVACGRMITMTGGHGWFYGQEVDGPDAVRRAVRERIKARADWVKFMASGGFAEEGEQPASSQLDPDELAAGVHEARKAGRKTCAHAHGAAAIKNVLRAGIDSVEHASFMDREAIDLLLERGAFIVPTFSIYYKMKETGAAHNLAPYLIDLVNRSWELKVARFVDAYRAGVRFAAGSDNGSPVAPHPDIATELEIFVRAGLTSYEALAGATVNAAQLLDLGGEIGTIEAGKRADLVVLRGDPLRDISAVRDVEAVIVDGQLRRYDAGDDRAILSRDGAAVPERGSGKGSAKHARE